MSDQRNCHWCGANVPELQRENARLLARVNELEQQIKGWKNLLVTEGDAAIKQVARLTAANARLRELLRECIEWIDYVSLKDRIKAELAEGE